MPDRREVILVADLTKRRDSRRDVPEVFKPILPNLMSSAALARERFKRALPLYPAQTEDEEDLRQHLTEEEDAD